MIWKPSKVDYSRSPFLFFFVVTFPLKAAFSSSPKLAPPISVTLSLHCRETGLHKVAKCENEQQELLRLPQTLFDTKIPAGHTVLQPFADDSSKLKDIKQWRSMAGIALLRIWKIDKRYASCKYIRSTDLTNGFWSYSILDLDQSRSLSVRNVSSQPTQPTKFNCTPTARSIQTTCLGIRNQLIGKFSHRLHKHALRM
ncbi:hypothetical protein Bca4012_028156 [Brassica carinata]